MKFREFFLKALESNSGVSSKRLCGFIGFMFCIIAIAYLCITGKEAPTILEMFLFCSVSLLGLDSIVGIFNRNINKVKLNSEQSSLKTNEQVQSFDIDSFKKLIKQSVEETINQEINSNKNSSNLDVEKKNRIEG